MSNLRALRTIVGGERAQRDVYVILKHTVPMTTTRQWLCELSRAANRPYLFIGSAPLSGFWAAGDSTAAGCLMSPALFLLRAKSHVGV